MLFLSDLLELVYDFLSNIHRQYLPLTCSLRGRMASLMPRQPTKGAQRAWPFLDEWPHHGKPATGSLAQSHTPT